MDEALNGLEPKEVWKYFGEIAKIPRPSKHEGAISRWVQEFAREHALALKTDKVGNSVIEVPATAGYEHAPSVCLQGHLDMVTEKNSSTTHDFMKEGIRLKRADKSVFADGTTLGADNGLGVSAMLALIDDQSAVHGPLELLMTVDEESGLTGAKGLDPSLVKSRILLNLDSEEEGALYVGCSGGRDTLASWDLQVEELPEKMQFFTFQVSGLKGGHSGLDIDKQRGNAIKILGRALLEVEKLGLRIGSLQGGNKRNAIPREAQVQAYIPVAKWALAEEKWAAFSALVKEEFHAADPGLQISWKAEAVKKGKVFTRILQKRLLRLIDAIPHGVQKFSHEIPGLVQTSTNFGVFTTGRKQISVTTSQRSSVASELSALSRGIGSLLSLAGGEVEHSTGYPGWKPNLSSDALKVVSDEHLKLFGHKPEVKAIHAGLECGIIGEKYPEMDMISFGPTIIGAHSPDEHVEIETVDKFYRLLKAVLKTYAERKVH
ncbi:MAG: aminoacyl-histidine dipeptidase [Proteobacteria bacterium]|nr:MAG: aminoacyl-histidine dipeptidase [Pseudomonadota bacterium]